MTPPSQIARMEQETASLERDRSSERARSSFGQLRRWLDRLLPPVCLVCGDPLKRGEGQVCGLCWARAPTQRPPLCRRCGMSLPDTGVPFSGDDCIECRAWLPYLRQARAPYAMRGTAAGIVHALKYGGWNELADTMGSRMARVCFEPEVESEIDGVVAIPLSRTRLRERGFNQSELLARAVAQERGLSFRLDVLVRWRHTRSQARLTPLERKENVSGAFRVREEARRSIEDTHLLLVDDVLTTAATVCDGVRALCSGGARSVSVLTFSRARPRLPPP